MKESVQLKGKFERFIEVFRSEASLLSDEERKRISNLDDFFHPCQLMIFKFGTQLKKYLIVTHDESRQDCEIELFEFEPWEAVIELEKISTRPIWDKELEQDDRGIIWRVENYQEIIERELLGIIRDLENSIFVKPPEKFTGGKHLVYKRDFMWNIFDENTFSPEDEAKKIVDDAKKQYIADSNRPKQKQNTEVKQESSSPNRLKGYGTYFYLPIWLDEYPELSFREKIRGTRASYHLDKKKIIETYRENTVIIEENGFIGICEEEKHLAKKYLNEIMGTGLLFGFPFFSVRDGDIAEFEAEPDKMRITSRQIIPRGNVMRRFDRTKPMWEPDILPYLDVSSDGLRKLLEISESINNEPGLTDCLILLSEAYTCMQSSQFIQSFIVSWTIIERYLYWIWDSHLEKSGTSKKRRKKLSEGPNWNISSVIEMLEINCLISKKEYKAITYLRRKRNKLIHEGEVVDQEDTTKCYNFSMIAMLSRTNAHIIHSEDALSRFITKIHDPYTF